MTRCSLGGVLMTAAACVAGCNGFGLDTYWRSDRYVLLAVDSRTQMHLAVDRGDGTAEGLVEPTVFSIGANDRYIVVRRHPSKNGVGQIDRSITQYFIVERTESSSIAEMRRGVQGPLTGQEYERLRTAWSLPSFTKTFSDLQ